MGGLQFHALLSILLITIKFTRNFGLQMTTIQVIVTLIVHSIKIIVARARPYNALEGIIHYKTERDYSFPSGHTAAAFATALLVATNIPAFSVLIFGMAFLIGYSRIYLGVHYPLDVLAGGLIGIGVTSALLGVGI